MPNPKTPFLTANLCTFSRSIRTENKRHPFIVHPSHKETRYRQTVKLTPISSSRNSNGQNIQKIRSVDPTNQTVHISLHHNQIFKERSAKISWLRLLSDASRPVLTDFPSGAGGCLGPLGAGGGLFREGAGDSQPPKSPSVNFSCHLPDAKASHGCARPRAASGRRGFICPGAVRASG